MTLLEIRTVIRGKLDDDIGATASQQVWSEGELTEYINDAVEVFCRELPLLIDSSTVQDAASVPLCLITTVDGTQDYALSDRVVDVERVKISGEPRPLDKGDVDLMDSIDPSWDDVSAEARQTPRRYLLDRETDKISFVRCPDDVYTVNLTVWRLPLVPLVADSSVPEIGSRFHRLLYSYILHLAYMNRDVEAFSEIKAADHMRLHLIDLEKARKEIDKKRNSRRNVGIGNAYRSNAAKRGRGGWGGWGRGGNC